MCGAYVSSRPPAEIGRGANIGPFEGFASGLNNMTRTSAFTWLQLVNETRRPAFEAAAVDAAQRLDPSGALAAQVRTFGIRAATNGAEPAQSGSFARAPPAPLHAVMWAGSPSAFAVPAYFIFDALSEPTRREALQRVLATSAPAATEPTPFTFADPPGFSSPSTVIYAPSAAATGGAIGAVCGSAFHWEDVLRDALPSVVNSIVALLRSPRGAEYTLQIRGREVRSVGAGDATRRLARRYAHMARREDAQVAGGTWTVTLFPTEELRRKYATNKPRDYALSIMAAGLFCAFVFAHCCRWFEFFDRDRIARVNRQLLAYVARLESMQSALAAGSAREADAKARALAEEASSRQKDQVRVRLALPAGCSLR